MNEIDPLATLTLEEVGERLGISPRTVRRKCREGVLPGIQMGGHIGWRIPAAELAKWLAEQSRPTARFAVSKRSEAAQRAAATRSRTRRRA